MVGSWLALPVLLFACVALSCSEQNVVENADRIPLWTDVYLRSELDWANADYKLSYLMDTYDIVSVEKCLYQVHNDQNTVSLPIFSPEELTLHVLYPGGPFCQLDLADAQPEAKLKDQDPLLLELQCPQMLPVNPEVS